MSTATATAARGPLDSHELTFHDVGASSAYRASPALRLLPTTVPPGPPAPDRPDLRVLEGGRAPARLLREATFRRRRRAALAVLGATIVVLILLASAISARIAGGGHPSAAAGASSPTPAAAAGAAGVAAPQKWVVRPGDTLWSIASSIAPEVDVRITVDRLVRANGEAPIVVGQALELP
ncbi:MAG: LysM peptidoglycan-binding domain-containing protein [Acidimicrobiales bacterium]|nr:LysM peptidoglycan-binding domain-containing protein [Acidimicrobiales bacterium]